MTLGCREKIQEWRWIGLGGGLGRADHWRSIQI
jgi:hypothetical protein